MMALDDGDGYEEKIPEGLAGVVLFPIMNATDALASIDILIGSASAVHPFNPHAAAFLSMCRTSIECSAQAIWVMSPLDRKTRRARAAGLARIGTGQARGYHNDSISAHENGLQELPGDVYTQAQHRRGFHDGELGILGSLGPENARQYTQLIRKSANWIEDNPPAHTDEVDYLHFPTVARSQYRLCSSFTHGHSWPIDLIGDGPVGMFRMMADAIATALIYTECAVSLFEAQSTDPDGVRVKYYPERLQPSIRKWREMYWSAEVGS